MTANCFSTVANKIIKLPDNKEVNNRVGGAQVWDLIKELVIDLAAARKVENIAYKQNHIFKDWDDVKNMQTIN